MVDHYARPLFAFVLCALGPVAQAITINATVVDARCGHSNGQILTQIFNGQAPFSYVWEPVPPVGQGSPQLMGLPPGSYTVTVTDAIGAVATRTFEVVNVPDLLGFDHQFPAQDGHANCPGSCAGQFRVPESYLPGTAPYTYSEPVQGYDQLGEPFFYVPGGACGGELYQITITDATGCSGVMDIHIAGAQIGQPPMAVTSITGACSGPGGQGGSATFTNIYDGQYWMPPTLVVDLNGLGQMQQVASGNSITFSGLSPGTYVLRRVWEYTINPCWDELQFTIPDLGVDCGSVSGQVFIDNDGDCLRGPSEVVVPQLVLTVEPGPHYAITGADGRYSIDLNDGSYTLAQNHPTLLQLCPTATPVPFTLAGDAQIIDLADSSTIQLDVVAQVAEGPARPGFALSYYMRARNLSAQLSGAVTMTMVFDPTLLYQGASITPATQVGNTLTWQWPELTAYASQQVHVQFTVPATTPIGTVLGGSLQVSTQNTDVVPGNNTRAISTLVTGSYDPNDKRALTSSRSSDAAYFIDSDEWIDYIIRFQNTGTDTAFTVVVTDTLSAVLDMGSFVQGVASHPYTVTFKPDRVVEWRFANILLPDSNVNEALSHGLVTFRIRPVEPLMPGRVIENIANIYFDFNEPVITEPSVLVAELSTSLRERDQQVVVFPNPTIDKLTVGGVEQGPWSIHAMDGRLVLAGRLQADRIIDIATLKEGPYLLQFSNDQRHRGVPILKIKNQ